MGLSSAIDWWDEWKLRILILCSLFVQSFLIFASYVREFYILRRLRVVVWLAYIGGDALAIYALATLFNRQKQQQTPADGGGNYAIEVIWAPVLLIHLGGQPFISAYSLEDNELWRRHVITLVSQVTVAVYVFCKWWSGDKKLLLVAIFLFIVGILKLSQKPWALRRASYASATSTNLSSPSRSAEDKSSCSLWCHIFPGQLEKKNPGGNDINCSLEEYVEKAQEQVKKTHEKVERHVYEAQQKQVKKYILEGICKMFVDLAVPYSVRLHYLQFFVNWDDESQHKMLRELIDLQFLNIYTWMRSSAIVFSKYTLFLVASLDIASVVLFAKSDKDGYSKSDITVTYILFLGTVVMELAPFLILLLVLLFGLCYFFVAEKKNILMVT